LCIEAELTVETDYTRNCLINEFAMWEAQNYIVKEVVELHCKNVKYMHANMQWKYGFFSICWREMAKTV